MTSPLLNQTGGRGVTTVSPTAPGVQGQTTLNDQRTNATFPTLNPPTMQTLVYSPNVDIQITHGLGMIDVSKDIVRGMVQRRENSASSLFFTLANPNLIYTQGAISRMDRVTCYLTRVNKLQSFSGYLDKIPWMQAYPGTVDFRATCTIKRLINTWWNPALPQCQQYFEMGAVIGNGDGFGGNDDGIGKMIMRILTDVGNFSSSQIHIQNFPQEFLVFLNNFLATNIAIGQQAVNNFLTTVEGPDLTPGPQAAVGYQASDPIGSPVNAATANEPFFLTQIVAAVDNLGYGPIVTVSTNDTNLAATGAALSSGWTAQVQEAGQQITQYTANQTLQNNNSDAAILALACVMVQSGNGSLEAITLNANSAVPDSLTYFYDNLFPSGTGCGLFNQPNDGNWGTTAQKMNPYSSAQMFLRKLPSGWRNMDPGQAINTVQNGPATDVALYDAAVTIASKTVIAYRSAQSATLQGANAALSLVPGGQEAVTGLLGGGANPISTALNSAVGVATTSPDAAAAVSTLTGKPTPDSEGAINAARVLIATPYSQTIGSGNTPGVGLDCSGMVQQAFKSIGISLSRTTYSQITEGTPIPPGQARRGDVLQTNGGGHTGIYLGDGTWIQTGGPDGTPGHIAPINPATAYSCRRMCENGGISLAAPWTSPALIGGGVPPGTGAQGGTGTSVGDPSSNEPIARNLVSYMFNPAAYSSELALQFASEGGEKAYIDGQSLMEVISALAGASLRNFQSAPNGDLIFYYPDHFGMDGKPAIYNIEDIELRDCHIDLSDDSLTTHVYVASDLSAIGMQSSATAWLGTAGVATVQNQGLYQRLIQAAPGDVDANLSADELMKRFGVRPYRKTYQMVTNGGLEFLLACQIFMGKWAAQYSTSLGVTFMPELFPGYRMNLVGHNLAVYVSEVTHTFDWEQGFFTQCVVGAAGNPNANHSIFSSLPGFLNPVQVTPTNPSTQTTAPNANPAVFAQPLPGGPLSYDAQTYGSINYGATNATPAQQALSHNLIPGVGPQ
jgi:cell wall-associated NlpC family hydrolase